MALLSSLVTQIARNQGTELPPEWEEFMDVNYKCRRDATNGENIKEGSSEDCDVEE